MLYPRSLEKSNVDQGQVATSDHLERVSWRRTERSGYPSKPQYVSRQIVFKILGNAPAGSESPGPSLSPGKRENKMLYLNNRVYSCYWDVTAECTTFAEDCFMLLSALCAASHPLPCFASLLHCSSSARLGHNSSTLWDSDGNRGGAGWIPSLPTPERHPPLISGRGSIATPKNS